jgi:hypothetical protein
MKDKILIPINASEELPPMDNFVRFCHGENGELRTIVCNNDWEWMFGSLISVWYREISLSDLLREELEKFAVYHNENSNVDVVAFEFIDQYLKNQ